MCVRLNVQMSNKNKELICISQLFKGCVKPFIELRHMTSYSHVTMREWCERFTQIDKQKQVYKYNSKYLNGHQNSVKFVICK